MGYSWTPINKGDIIRAAHFNEIKNHLEDLYDDLQLDSPSWTYFPVSVGEVILKAHIDELRNKTDYADDMNYCRGYQSGFLDSVEDHEDADDHGTYNKTYKGNEEVHHKGTYNSPHYNGEDGSYNNGTDTTECWENRTTVLEVYDSFDHYDNDGSLFAIYAPNAHDIDKSTEKSNQNYTVLDGDDN